MRGAGGFTLIELLVVVLIVGILASIAIPQYSKIVEKGRLAEALHCGDVIKDSQERQLLKTGAYVSGALASGITGLDLGCQLKYFTGSITGSGGTSWVVSFQRSASAPGYGSYTLDFTAGAGGQPSWRSTSGSVSADLLP